MTADNAKVRCDMATNLKMKNLSDVRRNIRGIVDDSQRGPVVIQRHGKPTAVLFGVESGLDAVELIAELTKVSASENQPLGIKQIRRLSDVLAATRKRQKGRPLKSHAEVVALLEKG